MTTRVEESRDVAVPVRVAYDQWTQFEDFPLFMPGIEEVRQERDDEVVIGVKRRGVSRSWRARITEQIPDARIAWMSLADRPNHAGVITFHRLDDDHCRLMLQFEFDPSGFAEKYADAVGIVTSWVNDALDEFVKFIENRGKPTGSWRGIVGRSDLSLTEGDTERHRPPTGEHRVAGESHAPEQSRRAASDDSTASNDNGPPSDDAQTTEGGRTRQMADGEIVRGEERSQSGS